MLLLSTATPRGFLKEASVPLAFTEPETPAVPAKVVTSPVLFKSKLNQAGRVVPSVMLNARASPSMSLPARV